MKIEFFHDVICSFCFPMSKVMRKLASRHQDIEIIHRSFALGWEAEDFIRMFGSRERAKDEVLSHWAHANEIDEEHRFNIAGMEKVEFLFPLSRKPLLAAKAAGRLGGETAYWAVFDEVQKKLFVENQNIEDEAVLEAAVGAAGFDVAEWRELYSSDETLKAVLKDFDLAKKYGVRSVPTLIIDGREMVYGAKSLERLEMILTGVGVFVGGE